MLVSISRSGDVDVIPAGVINAFSSIFPPFLLANNSFPLPLVCRTDFPAMLTAFSSLSGILKGVFGALFPGVLALKPLIPALSDFPAAAACKWRTAFSWSFAARVAMVGVTLSDSWGGWVDVIARPCLAVCLLAVARAAAKRVWACQRVRAEVVPFGSACPHYQLARQETFLKTPTPLHRAPNPSYTPCSRFARFSCDHTLTQHHSHLYTHPAHPPQLWIRSRRYVGPYPAMSPFRGTISRSTPQLLHIAPDA
mgnify:CR=1 FL=1